MKSGTGCVEELVPHAKGYVRSDRDAKLCEFAGFIQLSKFAEHICDHVVQPALHFHTRSPHLLQTLECHLRLHFLDAAGHNIVPCVGRDWDPSCLHLGQDLATKQTVRVYCKRLIVRQSDAA